MTSPLTDPKNPETAVPTWDPERYLIFADDRARPFLELLSRVDVEAPETVVDLGCGPGNLTALLAERWPAAHVTGLDSSPEMIAKAQQDQGADDHVSYAVADLRDWRPAEPVDVLVSNATLQWVPDHLELQPQLLASVRPGGWLAFQVPGNFDEPSHTVRRELEQEEPYAAYTDGIARPASHDPIVYLEALTALGCTVDAWETTYLHVLQGPHPVFTWVSGTSARPALQALPDDLRPEFEEKFKRRLADVYPEQPHGVVLPFRRVFVAARTAA